MLWRQGDVFIESVALIPGGAVQQSHLVLVEGELTGHSHRIADPDTAILYDVRGELFVQVISPQADVVHQEHGTIRLPHGTYRVWRQREFDPGAPPPRRNRDGRLDPRPNSRWVFD
jgi:hypothetical protein